MSHVRDAQTRLLPIHAETCPHYLFLLSDKLCGEAQDHFCGAKHVSSPPLRHDPRDLENLWKGIVNGTFTTWSSDHAPSKYNVPHGKRLALIYNLPRFRKYQMDCQELKGGWLSSSTKHQLANLEKMPDSAFHVSSSLPQQMQLNYMVLVIAKVPSHLVTTQISSFGILVELAAVKYQIAW